VPDAALLLASDGKARFLVHSIVTGKLVSSFSLPDVEEVRIARLSPDGRWMLTSVQLANSPPTAGWDGSATYLVDVREGKVVRTLKAGRYQWDDIDGDPISRGQHEGGCSRSL
jgi:hypothetical protein